MFLMAKIIDPLLKKDMSGFYTVNANLNHEDLDILVEALNTLIHKGIPDETRRNNTLALYTEIFSFWENTTANPTPIDPAFVKIPDQECKPNAHWDSNMQKCVPNAGFYEDENGDFKPLPITDCGNNAHFDAEKGCVCNDGFVRDKSGNCVPIEVKP